MMQPNKISLVSLVAGVVMFFLPWIEVQCQGAPFIRQSGAQAVLGTASLAEPFAKEAKGTQQPDGKGAPQSLLVLAAGILTALAMWTAWLNVRDDIYDPVKTGRFAALAVALIGVQMWIGFPIETRLRDEMKKGMDSKSAGLSSSKVSAQKDPLAVAMEQQFSSAIQEQLAGVFQTKYTPAFYLCLAALAVPALQWLTASSKRRDGEGRPGYSS